MQALKSFYRYYSKGRRLLALDTQGAVKISTELQRSTERSRYAWGSTQQIREKMFNITMHARDLFDQTAITFLYRTGCRKNVLEHLKIKHVQDRIKLEDPVTGEKEELLCLTIFGYNPDTKEGLCAKTFHYNFPTLLDDPEGRHGYYTYLAKDSLKLFDKFMEKYHPNPDPEDYVFYLMRYGKTISKKEPLNRDGINRRYKKIIERTGLPPNLIWIHQLKELATTVIEASLSKEESYRAEFLTGHILHGVKEHYHKRNKVADGQAYLRVQFLPSDAKDQRIKELENKIEKAEQQPKAEEPKEDAETLYARYTKDVNQVEKEPKKPEPTTPKQPAKVEPKWDDEGAVWCPKDDKWVHLGICEVCKTAHHKIWADCQLRRIKNPNDPIFQPIKPKPMKKW